MASTMMLQLHVTYFIYASATSMRRRATPWPSAHSAESDTSGIDIAIYITIAINRSEEY